MACGCHHPAKGGWLNGTLVRDQLRSWAGQCVLVARTNISQSLATRLNRACESVIRYERVLKLISQRKLTFGWCHPVLLSCLHPCSPIQSLWLDELFLWLNSYLVLIAHPLSYFFCKVDEYEQASSQSLMRKATRHFSTNPNFDCMTVIQWASRVCQRPNTGVGVFLAHDELSSLQMTEWILSITSHQLYNSGTLIIQRSLQFFLSSNSSDSAGTAVIQEAKWLSQRSWGTRLDSLLYSFHMSKCPWARTATQTCVGMCAWLWDVGLCFKAWRQHKVVCIPDVQRFLKVLYWAKLTKVFQTIACLQTVSEPCRNRGGGDALLYRCLLLPAQKKFTHYSVDLTFPTGAIPKNMLKLKQLRSPPLASHTSNSWFT